MRSTIGSCLIALLVSANLHAQTSAWWLATFSVSELEGWTHDVDTHRSSFRGTAEFRRGQDTVISLRVVHGEGMGVERWYAKSVREASASGSVLLRDPAERKIDGRSWQEARFRARGATPGTTRTVIVSATKIGPLVLEASLQAPARAWKAPYADFERLRSRVTFRDFSDLFRPSKEKKLRGTWKVLASTTTRSRTCVFDRSGSLDGIQGYSLLEFRRGDPATAPTNADADADSTSYAEGDLLFVAHTAAGRPLDIRILRRAR